MLLAGALAAGAIGGSTIVLGWDVGTGLGAYLELAFAGTLGYLVGSLAGWQIGRRGGRSLIERHGRWLHLGPARMDRRRALVRLPWRQGGAAGSSDSACAVVHLDTRRCPRVAAARLRRPHRDRVGDLVLRLRQRRWALGTNFDALHRGIRYADILALIAIIGVVTGLLVRHRRT